MSKSRKIKLPKPFSTIIYGEYKIISYTIIEAYLDELEYNLNDYVGVNGLREFLGLSGSDSVCDCYCKLKLGDGRELAFIFEDKNSKHQKNPKEAKKQLEETALLKKSY